MPETCAKCGTPVVAGHSWTPGGARRAWRLCCLCTGELIEKLDQAQERAA